MIPFRFDGDRHLYVELPGERLLPHITGMLVATGHVDDRWYTEEGRDRGTAVHQLTTDYDLGALPLAGVMSGFRPYLLNHAKGVMLTQPAWLHIEVPFVHRTYRYGGRPDRVGRLRRVGEAVAVAEVKSGPVHKSHGIQLALQAILVSDEVGLPARSIQRYGWYVTAKRFHLEHFVDPGDFDQAMEVIQQCCHV